MSGGKYMSELDIGHAENIRQRLRHEDVRVFAYNCTDSTNLRAREYVREAGQDASAALFVAREQTCGRGRLGRSFLSRRDCGVYMSIAYFTSEELSDAISITTAAAVFAAAATERATGKKCKIKWVNDIYTVDGKVAGILTETMRVGDRVAVIVGLGINFGSLEFPDELKGIAASAGDIDDESREVLIAEITDKLLSHSADPKNRGYMIEYRRRFMLEGESVELIRAGESVGNGKVLGVSDDGGLIFLPEGEEKSVEIHTGEVSIRSADK